MHVPAALETLKGLKGVPPEFKVSVNTPSTTSGKGSGIYVRSRNLPANGFTVSVTPILKEGTVSSTVSLKTVSLVPSAPWIKTPPDLWVQSGARTFQVTLDRAVLAEPGVHSEKITGIDEATGLVVFEVPVTVIAPSLLTDENAHTLVKTDRIKVGQTLRYFLDVPAGATSIQLDLASDGPVVRAQFSTSKAAKLPRSPTVKARFPCRRCLRRRTSRGPACTKST